MNTVEVLRKARDHIAQPGMWWQGRFFKGLPDGRFPRALRPCCPVGACMWATRTQPSGIWKAKRTLQESMDTFTSYDSVESWNDAPGRTQAEVVALFDRAIALAEKEADHG